jgi:hypothetical protein
LNDDSDSGVSVLSGDLFQCRAKLIQNVSFSIRILQHVSFAVQDKNVGVRLFATGWLRFRFERRSFSMPSKASTGSA